MDISDVKYEDVVFVDEVVFNDKTYTRIHVPVYDDSKYTNLETELLLQNIEKERSGKSDARQLHFITENCIEEKIGYTDNATLIVCFYYIPSNTVLDAEACSYYYPKGHLDITTDEIPEEYLTKKRVIDMLNAVRSTVPFEIVKKSDEVIRIDAREDAYARLKSGEYNDVLRKPLNPGSKEYKNGKRYIPILFHYYLHELIKAGLKACPKPIKDNLPNNTARKGRKGIPPEDYFFCMIDQVYEKRADLEYSGIIPNLVKDGYISSNWSTNGISVHAMKPELIPFLEFLITYSAVAMRRYEHIFAVDATGFRCTTRNDYYGEKHHQKKENDWVDAHSLVGVNSNIVISCKAAHKYKVDELVALEDLINDALHFFSMDYILGDGGYMSDEKLNYYYEKYHIKLVFPIKSNTIINSDKNSKLWNDNNRLNLSDIWDEIYHPRSNVESVFASMKKSIGEIIYAKNENARLIEVYCKFIVYNIRVLILYYAIEGIVPDWINEDKVSEMICS